MYETISELSILLFGQIVFLSTAFSFYRLAIYMNWFVLPRFV